MFFEPGFLGTKAAMYMDVVTLYFALLPLLLLFSIRFAVKGDYEKHFRSQIAVLALTVVMVIAFEVGVRLSGGFIGEIMTGEYGMLLIAYLVLHILIALAAVGGWIYLIIASMLAYRREGRDSLFFRRHKRMGQGIFAALTLTSLMGCSIYAILFVI